MLEGNYMLYDSIVVTLILLVDAAGLFLLHKKELERQQRRIKRVVSQALKELHHAKRKTTS